MVKAVKPTTTTSATADAQSKLKDAAQLLLARADALRVLMIDLCWDGFERGLDPGKTHFKTEVPRLYYGENWVN